MWISRAKRVREGGWMSRMPWRRSRVETRRRSFCPLEALLRSRSRVVVRRIATAEFSSREQCSSKVHVSPLERFSHHSTRILLAA